MRVAGAGLAAGDLRLCPRYNGHTRDAYFSVGLQGVAEADVARVRDIIDRTLDDVIACVRPCAAPASAPPRPAHGRQCRRAYPCWAAGPGVRSLEALAAVQALSPQSPAALAPRPPAPRGLLRVDAAAPFPAWGAQRLLSADWPGPCVPREKRVITVQSAFYRITWLFYCRIIKVI